MLDNHAEFIEPEITAAELNDFLNGGPKSAEYQAAAFPALGKLIKEFSDILYKWHLNERRKDMHLLEEGEALQPKEDEEQINKLIIIRSQEWARALGKLATQDAYYDLLKLSWLKGFLNHLSGPLRSASGELRPEFSDPFTEYLESLQEIIGEQIKEIDELNRRDRFFY